MLRGSNLPGGDCVWDSFPVATGPVSGQNYLFVTTAEVDRLVAEGMTAFRLVFSWECVQPKPWQVLGAATGNYLTYWNTFKALVDYITITKGLTCLFDCHGGRDSTFGAYRDVKIGGKTPTGELVADLFENLYWNLGTVFKGNANVQWGLTNEPVGMTAAIWFAAAQRAINALRNTGAKQRVWAPGIAFSGAGTWVTSGNAAAWNLTDPANNLGVQVHLYVDANSGGGATDIVNSDIGVTRLKATVDWCRSKGLQCFVGEVAMSAANSIGAATWGKLNAYTEANSDVVAGWTWWSCGPLAWWSSYQFTLCNSTIGLANLGMIRSALKPAPPVDVAALQAQISTLAAQLATMTSKYQSEVSAHNATLADLGAALARVDSLQLSLSNANTVADHYASQLAAVRAAIS